ncbi:MAG: flavin reductase family protein [Oscillospiraceae bacterium]|nr:flavin reductase family protein [Oscillospiraceae bacterium]
MFKEINIKELNGNFVKMISEDWALLTAGNSNCFNTMTVSWGGIGELWGKDVGFVFVRPQRYTYRFMEKHERFTLAFFGGECKKELSICGSKSGRDIDKIAETGLKPISLDGAVGFEQAKVVIVMKKIAYQDINPKGFLDPSITEIYKTNDFHRAYVGEIEKVYIAE